MRFLVSTALAMVLGAGGPQPPRLREAPSPALSPRQHGQCHAAFDVSVDPGGAVTEVRLLYGTGPLGPKLRETIARWVFAPAVEDGEPRASHVLVAALFRAAALYALGPCSPPDVALLAPPGLPLPMNMSPPAYPARASGGGVVIVEVAVDPSGQVHSARAVGERTGFDGAAEQAARAWRFVPARRQGQPVASRAYLVLGFPEPVLAPEPS